MITRLHTHPSVPLVTLALLLMNAACIGSYERIESQENRNILDDDGNIIGTQTTTTSSGGAVLDVEDRVLDLVPLPRQRVYIQQGPADVQAPPQEVRSPQGTTAGSILDAFELVLLEVQFEPGGLTIDDDDWLEFEVAWHVDIREHARTVILDTFPGATLPTQRSVAYSGPANQGIELAALLGLSEMTLPVSAGSFTLDPLVAWPALLDTFTLRIDRHSDSVRLNGVQVMTLGPAAHALDY